MNTYKHEVKYYECDRMGITHHSNYVRIMEEARVDYLDQLGYGFDRIEAEGVVSPVISVSCNYKRPTTFKDVIEVEVSISNMQDLKFEFTYTTRSYVSDRARIALRKTASLLSSPEGCQSCLRRSKTAKMRSETPLSYIGFV